VTNQAERPIRRRWLRRTLAGAAAFLLVVLLATLYVAYLWRPPEVSGYQSRYLDRVGHRQVQTQVARFYLGLPDWQSRRFAPPGAERVHDLIGSVVVDRPARKAASSLASGA
jgi:hypothetical protein